MTVARRTVFGLVRRTTVELSRNGRRLIVYFYRYNSAVCPRRVDVRASANKPVFRRLATQVICRPNDEKRVIRPIVLFAIRWKIQKKTDPLQIASRFSTPRRRRPVCFVLLSRLRSDRPVSFRKRDNRGANDFPGRVVFNYTGGPELITVMASKRRRRTTGRVMKSTLHVRKYAVRCVCMAGGTYDITTGSRGAVDGRGLILR